MARINLLPWREARRKEREKQFFLILGLSAILAVGVVVYINSYVDSLSQYQTQRNHYLQQQIAIVDKQIHQIKDLERQKNDLLARMEIIQQLQASRPQIVHLFDELTRVLPMGMYIEDLKRQGHTDVLSGVAESNARISAFMRNLDASPVFENPRLDVIEKIGRERRTIRTFILRVDESQRSQVDREKIYKVQ